MNYLKYFQDGGIAEESEKRYPSEYYPAYIREHYRPTYQKTNFAKTPLESNYAYLDPETLKKVDRERRMVDKQIDWLHNWYQKRLPVIGKEHLQEYVDAGLGVPYYTTEETNMSSDPDRSKGLAGRYGSNPLDTRKPSEIKEKGYDLNTRIDFFTYFPLSSTGVHFFRPTLPIHEFTHATQYGGSGKFNPDFTNGQNVETEFKWYDDNDPTKIQPLIKYKLNYLQRPDEQHARIMELRYLNNLDPTKTDYNLDDLKTFKEASPLRELRESMTDDEIINALNTWASNNKSSFNLGNGVYRSAKGGKIYIKPKNRGKFTKSAKAAGEGVQEHAHKVMNDPHATTLQKRRALFAINSKKWNHKKKHSEGGTINYVNYFI